MSRKKKQHISRLGRSSRDELISQSFYNPFEELDQQLRLHLRRRSAERAAPRPEEVKAKPVEKLPDEDTLFRKAMADVTPLPQSRHERVAPPPPTSKTPRFWAQEELDAYTSLVDLVAGEGTFELTYSDEYVDGAVVGLSPKVLKKLRNGDLSYQDYVDLHGHNLDQAYDVVVNFLQQSFTRGHRCVLLIPGRGLNSHERKPVLKKNLVNWLTHAPLKRIVLAFASARSYDGGVGALYVLMRKRAGKSRFITPIPE